MTEGNNMKILKFETVIKIFNTEKYVYINMKNVSHISTARKRIHIFLNQPNGLYNINRITILKTHYNIQTLKDVGIIERY